jgi:hypothetical protein
MPLALSSTVYPWSGLPFWLRDLIELWVVVAWALTALIHLVFAWSVLIDADRMWRTERRKPVFVGASLWALATLLGGVLAAGVYWVMHHSTLRPPAPPVLAAPGVPCPRPTPSP